MSVSASSRRAAAGPRAAAARGRALQPPGTGRTFLAVLRHSLRLNRRAPLVWGGALGAMGALMAAIWPSIEDSMTEVLANYPQALKDAFNIATLDSVEAYVDAEMYSLIVPLIVAFLAVRIVTQAISTAEERGHLDTLLALPLRRSTIAAAAFAVCAIVVAATLAVMTLMTWVAGIVAGADPSLLILGRGAANVWPLAMFFAGLALLAAGRLRRAAPVTAVATGTLVAMYVVDLVGRLSEPMEPVRWVSAFRYYGSAVRDGIDPLTFAGVTVAGALLAVAGAWLLERRDIA